MSHTFSSPSGTSQGKDDSDAKEELENFSQLYFKYTKLCEDQSAAMRHDMERLGAAYATVCPEHIAEQRSRMLNPDNVQPYLDELARRCEVHPHSFEESVLHFPPFVRVECFAAASASFLRPVHMPSL